MDVRLALVALYFILVMIQSSDCGKRNRVVIHVPYKIKNVKHMHTVYKTIHIHKHPENHKPHEAQEAHEAHEEVPERAEIEAEAEEHEHEHFHHQHIHKVDKHGKVIPPYKHKNH